MDDTLQSIFPPETVLNGVNHLPAEFADPSFQFVGFLEERIPNFPATKGRP